MKKSILQATGIVFAALALVAIVYKTNVNTQVQQLHLQTQQAEIDAKNKIIEKNQKVIDKKDVTEKELEEALEVIEEQQTEIEALQAKKAEEARIAAENSRSAAVAAPQASQSISGTKTDWMKRAGIPEAHWGYVDSIVTRESGWNPNAVNPSSGACGLGQQLPCGKWPGAWNDPVAALKAMTVYVNDRYGGWAGAVSFWNANHWY